MNTAKLGEFEELVLLMIVLLEDDAYGLAICEELQEQTKRSTTIGAVHATLVRLEKKGFTKSHLGDPTGERGGRRKRLFKLTAFGKKVLIESCELKINIWRQIPELSLKMI